MSSIGIGCSFARRDLVALDGIKNSEKRTHVADERAGDGRRSFDGLDQFMTRIATELRTPSRALTGRSARQKLLRSVVYSKREAQLFQPQF